MKELEKETIPVDAAVSSDKKSTSTNNSLTPHEVMAFGVLLIITVAILSLGGFFIYQETYVVPARMEADFYQHYWYEDGCDDHITLVCAVSDTFHIPMNTRLHRDDNSFLERYCIPQCEMAYRHPFPTDIAWKGACSKTPYNYYLFNRTQYEMTAPETLCKPAEAPATADESVEYDEL